MAGAWERVTDWMLKTGIAEVEPDTRPKPEANTSHPPKEQNR